MLTEEEWNKFLQELEWQQNIYDILVLLYLQIEGEHKRQYIKEYYKMLDKISEDYWGDLGLITNEMLMEKISFEFYIEKFKTCITKEKLRNVAVRMLMDFERYFEQIEEFPALSLERESISGKIYKFGPLNKVSTEYSFYLMPDYHYFKDFNREQKLNIRFMDYGEFSGIDVKIRRYNIVKKERLKKQVNIKYYDGMKGISKTYPELKVGIVPVAKKLWCKDIYEEYPKGEKGYFRLEDIKERLEEMNEAYIKVLEKCIDEGVQIVVFPELAQNAETERVVKSFLAMETVKGQHSLELVFLGSLWENGKNEGVLFSGTGTILLRNQKIEPFFMEKDGKTYWEDLQQEAKKIELLDIPKLGRIQYLICKDGLDSGWQHTIWGAFQIAISFISSYSESVSHFENLGNSFSIQYGGVQILANACAARIANKDKIMESGEEKEIGSIVVPCGKGGKGDAFFQKEKYTEIEHCKQECCFGQCIRVFRINPMLIWEKDGILGNYISSDCIIL